MEEEELLLTANTTMVSLVGFLQELDILTILITKTKNHTDPNDF